VVKRWGLKYIISKIILDIRNKEEDSKPSNTTLTYKEAV